jgi:hypothetical protein
MGKIVISTNVSLDGVAQDPGGKELDKPATNAPVDPP